MGKFLSGLSLTPAAVIQAQALGLSLDDVQKLVLRLGLYRKMCMTSSVELGMPN